MKSTSIQKNRLSVFIAGDDSLVNEYSEIASAFNYAIISPDKINNLKPIAGKISIALELRNLNLDRKKKNLAALDKALPETTAVLSSSINVSALDQSQWIMIRHRLVGIAALPTMIRNSIVEVSPTVYTNESAVDVARKFFLSIKKDIAIVQA